jgi:hypothetical protein
MVREGWMEGEAEYDSLVGSVSRVETLVKDVSIGFPTSQNRIQSVAEYYLRDGRDVRSAIVQSGISSHLSPPHTLSFPVPSLTLLPPSHNHILLLFLFLFLFLSLPPLSPQLGVYVLCCIVMCMPSCAATSTSSGAVAHRVSRECMRR